MNLLRRSEIGPFFQSFLFNRPTIRLKRSEKWTISRLLLYDPLSPTGSWKRDFNLFLWSLIMADPVIVQKKPFIVELEPGKYWWCSCGKSANQPFCDGSHKGSGFTPVEFEVTETTKMGLCGCKYSENKPRCDSTHKEL